MKSPSLLLNRWLLGVVASLALVGHFFYAEIVRHSADGFHGHGPLDDVQVGLTARELSAVTGYKLVPLANNLDQVHVRHVHVVDRDEGTRTLAFDLVSDVPGNDYPELQLRLLTAEGHELRSVLLPPERYVHGSALVDEEVRLRIPAVDGAARASIEPVYGAKRAGAS